LPFQGIHDPQYHQATSMPRRLPEIVEVNSQRIEEMLDRATSQMDHDDAELMRRIVESYAYITDLVEDKNTSIARLRKLFFGAKTEKAKNVIDEADPEEADAPPAVADGDPAESGASATNDPPPAEADTPPPQRGHGRYGADDYSGASQVNISHPTLAAGDPCPDCNQGTLYEKQPRALVRFVGQAPLDATVYRLQRLRCHLCNKVFTAPTPPEVGDDKYDITAASMIGLLKYGSGLPFNRLQRLQRNCEIPLAASTQWDIVHATASLLLPAYDELIRQAAQGEVLYNDDTTVRILELMGERARKHPPENDEHDPGRTGLFTSGVVASHGGVRIALFFSGRQHAGENLADVLQHRAAELEAPIHMCDGLAQNIPQELETILANCLAHARRRFVDIYDRFTNECRHLIETLSKIYHHDQIAREDNLSPEERLLYHQTHSRPIMDELHHWLQCQLDEKRVEPNSALGEAISYMLKRWGRLTVFLRKAGAPLDNNTCERMLKKAILHRKNSMFFKTRNGARLGDMYMSLIYTCELAGGNAFDYLNQLQLNSADVAKAPQQWMPWNYRANTQVDAA
jgi:transposase